jgi:uncharacterized protein YlxW (UPF0749 family)
MARLSMEEVKALETITISGQKPEFCEIIDLIQTIKHLQQKNEQLMTQVSIMREALEHIAEYWNRDNNEKAMEDACWHTIETAEEALAEIDKTGGRKKMFEGGLTT